MKKLAINLLTSLLLLIVIPLHAQQSWQWGQRVGIMVKDMATDGAGNVYALWSLHGSYTIDGHYIAGNGDGDIALTSFSCNGSYRWTKVIGGVSGDVGVGVGTDTLGGVYVAGSVFSDAYQQTINVSDDSTLAPTYKTMLLVKYDTAGNYQWLRMPEPDTLSSHSLSNQFNMDVSPNGNCYWYCLLSPGSYGNGNYVATYPYDYFGNRGSCVYALKYDRNGNCTGGVHFDMSYSGPSIIYTKFKWDPITKGYYAGGYISAFAPGQDTLIFGSTVISLAGYVVSFDSTGAFKWIQTSNNDPQIVTPVVDQQGSIYVTGGTQNEDTLAGWPFDGGLYGYPFLVKLDPSDGHALWGTNASTTSVDWGKAVNVTNNTVGVAGDYAYDIEWGNFSAHNTAAHNEDYNVFLARFNATTGAIVGFDTLASSLNAPDHPSVLATDKQGNFYVAGTFTGTLYVGNSTIYNQSSNTDGFIAKFGSANCNCTLPAAHYSHSSPQSGGTISFTYDGSIPVDSVVWDFGDGESGNGTSVTHNYPQDGSYTVCATAYNDCGSNMYCETLQVGDVGIGKIPGFTGISIYPNPATEEIIIDNAERGIVLDIYNVTGQQMLHQVLKGTKDKVNVSNLSSGVYLMRFKGKEGRQGNSKFVKQ